jgi:hypothetical protein
MRIDECNSKQSFHGFSVDHLAFASQACHPQPLCRTPNPFSPTDSFDWCKRDQCSIEVLVIDTSIAGYDGVQMTLI